MLGVYNKSGVYGEDFEYNKSSTYKKYPTTLQDDCTLTYSKNLSDWNYKTISR